MASGAALLHEWLSWVGGGGIGEEGERGRGLIRVSVKTSHTYFWLLSAIYINKCSICFISSNAVSS